MFYSLILFHQIKKQMWSITFDVEVSRAELLILIPTKISMKKSVVLDTSHLTSSDGYCRVKQPMSPKCQCLSPEQEGSPGGSAQLLATTACHNWIWQTSFKIPLDEQQLVSENYIFRNTLHFSVSPWKTGYLKARLRVNASASQVPHVIHSKNEVPNERILRNRLRRSI